MKFLIAFIAAVIAVASAQESGQPPISISAQSWDSAPDGSYSFSYQSENGISVSENGALGRPNGDGEVPVVAQGQFGYTSPEGTPISVSYTADENGFRPQGSHLHAAILRALEWNLAHPEQNEQPQKNRNPYSLHN